MTKAKRLTTHQRDLATLLATRWVRLGNELRDDQPAPYRFAITVRRAEVLTIADCAGIEAALWTEIRRLLDAEAA